MRNSIFMRHFWLNIILVLLCALVGISFVPAQAVTLDNVWAADTRTPTKTPRSTRTPRPTKTPKPTNTPRPTATPTLPTVRSAGLGLTIAEWEERWGEGVETLPGWKLYADTWEIMETGDFITHIERVYAGPVSPGFALGSVSALLPKDAELLDDNAPSPSAAALVQLYNSASLAARLGPDDTLWAGGEPGDFITIFNLDDNVNVKRVVIVTGNNP